MFHECDIRCVSLSIHFTKKIKRNPLLFHSYLNEKNNYLLFRRSIIDHKSLSELVNVFSVLSPNFGYNISIFR